MEILIIVGYFICGIIFASIAVPLFYFDEIEWDTFEAGIMSLCGIIMWPIFISIALFSGVIWLLSMSVKSISSWPVKLKNWHDGKNKETDRISRILQEAIRLQNQQVDRDKHYADQQEKINYENDIICETLKKLDINDIYIHKAILNDQINQRYNKVRK